MPVAGQPLRKLGFLTIGRFDGDDPREGHLETIRTIERAEQLGFDSVWLRCRHLQYGISSPVAIMAAAAMRTSRIELGTAVIPLGLENPMRLAEDLATVDLLSDGRVNPGVSVGTPMRYDDYKHTLYPDTHDVEDFSKERVLRLMRCLRGEPASDFEGTVGIENFSRRVQPHAPGLADRVWYGGGLSSAIWAGEQGLNYLTSSVVTTEGSDSTDFATIQGEQIAAYRAHHPAPQRARVSQGLVVIPTDSATPDQVRKYREYADTRLPRTREPQGPRRMLFAPDLVGTSDELAETLWSHAGFQGADEVAFALPFSFDEADYAQIIEDLATRLGPALGWSPRHR
ncbi:LLM class flavin-dependent oxidoreductase [Williamsia deligens]|uniref:LLM class flavin-dependent oxidoreductase n=1 Tax=Williamsia deligens TaxID=321325 RepID=A0ABW3GAU9_9NOCA|nr:LLM class flavin-dependent oxidoreductase [Williamsia deligens]MCP2196104.1 Flavin-dependent oxidoreductase, luciferase family (includes alkanesulfonate monooxygenase SsuD and methylene tetrahydromethanopterin reductase) [Williamsia deligens]